VEGSVEVSFTERGVLIGHSERILVQRSFTAYTNDPSASDTTPAFPFSITLPPTCDTSATALPPSTTYQPPGFSMEIEYHVRVDMSRSGLRRADSLTIPIMYLPRTYAPHLSSQQLANDRLPSYNEDIQTLHPLTRVTSPSATLACSDVSAHVTLPSPLKFASGNRIPFVIMIRSGSPATTALYTDVIFQIIKRTTARWQTKLFSREKVISTGAIHNIVEQGGVRLVHGELGTGVRGAEMSWSADEVVQVKVNVSYHIFYEMLNWLAQYTARLTISAPVVATKLPTLKTDIPIEIFTHSYTGDDDITSPALELVPQSRRELAGLASIPHALGRISSGWFLKLCHTRAGQQTGNGQGDGAGSARQVQDRDHTTSRRISAEYPKRVTARPVQTLTAMAPHLEAPLNLSK
ncbi:hypothetical protein FRC11_013451, partial [Ceratobasidium sp. 423]